MPEERSIHMAWRDDETAAMSAPAAPNLDAIVNLVKHRHHVRVHRWRKSMSGCAWQTTYDNGQTIRWIECPYPKTPLSLSIFLHEVGNHVLGFDRFKRRAAPEKLLASTTRAKIAMRSRSSIATCSVSAAASGSIIHSAD